MFSLVIVEPDIIYARALRDLLEAEEFRVRGYDSAAAALSAIRGSSFDLCLLSLDLDGVDGVAVCGALRKERPGMPIIAGLDRFDEPHRVCALIAGADDVVPRPANGRELIARIRAVLRRSGKGRSGPAYQDDELTVLLNEMRVIVRGSSIALSLGETRVLTLLIREAPAPVPVARIHNELALESDPVKRTTIEARIKSLRRKLGKHRIETLSSFGYAFVPRID